MWCDGCQRGQKNLIDGRCPDCGLILNKNTPTTHDEKPKSNKVEFGGGYTEDKSYIETSDKEDVIGEITVTPEPITEEKPKKKRGRKKKSSE